MLGRRRCPKTKRTARTYACTHARALVHAYRANSSNIIRSLVRWCVRWLPRDVSRATATQAKHIHTHTHKTYQEEEWMHAGCIWICLLVCVSASIGVPLAKAAGGLAWSADATTEILFQTDDRHACGHRHRQWLAHEMNEIVSMYILYVYIDTYTLNIIWMLRSVYRRILCCTVDSTTVWMRLNARFKYFYLVMMELSTRTQRSFVSVSVRLTPMRIFFETYIRRI